MRDMNELLQHLGGGTADPQLLLQLQTIAGSAECRALADRLTGASAEEMRQAVQRGSASGIQQAVGNFLNTPEGAALAEQLRQALGKRGD
ncbi:MAG: hypothetical protein IJ452_06925 [Butyricicoccus sp.]|nr:hypothetical protein [Butyricicoccus sp.]MBQ8585996.1 hypothetical protein [Butyricicoccus sp.]